MTPAHLHPTRKSKIRIRHHSGFTLIHMITVIAMMSILMTMTGVIIQFLLRSDQSVSQQSVLELTILKLSRQFRDDVHAATQCGPMNIDELRGDSLELSGPTPELSRVHYRVAAETLVRELFAGNVVANREVYRLPECHIQLQVEAIDAQPLDERTRSRFLVLAIDRAGLTIVPHQRPVHGNRNLSVVAELGRTSRILTSGPADGATKTSGVAGLKESSDADDNSEKQVTP